MSESKNMYDAIVIGGGPAGLTAALYLARACYRVLVIEKDTFGGQITITASIINYPGVEESSGRALTENMRKQAESFGAEFLKAEVTAIEAPNDSDIKTVRTDKGTYECFGIVLATGAHPRMVGFPGEAKYKGRGIAYCATCDGEFFTGKEVFVVGGGFAAAEESVFLTRYANHVTILIRGNDFTCADATAQPARENENITVLTNTEVVEAGGDEILKTLTYKNTKTGEQTVFAPENDTFGVFVFAGYAPATELVKDIVDLNEQGYVLTDRRQCTSREGIFAAGDVCEKNLRQVVTAVGDGATAATELEKYASAMHKKTGIIPRMPVPKKKKAPAVSASTNSDAGASSGGASSGSSLFSQDMLDQLEAVFDRMENKLILSLQLNDSDVAKELEAYMNELASHTDKLTVIVGEHTDPYLPCVHVLREDKSDTGLSFHGVPGGHEFTSFVLGLYNASGPGQPMDDELKNKVKSIADKKDLQIFVSLSCTMCPELVTAAQQMASLNDNISAAVYDLNHYSDLKDKYNVMSVPCMVVNGDKVYFGKKNVSELTEILETS